MPILILGGYNYEPDWENQRDWPELYNLVEVDVLWNVSWLKIVELVARAHDDCDALVGVKVVEVV